MTAASAGSRTGPGVREYVLYLVGVAGLAFAITSVWIGMRAVMDIGGSCASGGPYEVSVQCPDKVGLMMFLAFPLGFLSAGLMVWMGTRLGGGYAGLVGLAWPALFLSLGWNFLEYSVHPPDAAGGGIVWGWLIPGIIFVLMGGIPLLGWFETRDHTTIVPGAPPRPTPRDFGELRDAMVQATRAASAIDPSAPIGRTLRRGVLPAPLSEAIGGGSAFPRAPALTDFATELPGTAADAEPGSVLDGHGVPASTDTDRGTTSVDADALVSHLERLAQMHRSGDLADEEFVAAKRALIASMAHPV